MKYSIQTMDTKLQIDGRELKGYAFIDKDNHCMIIVYGENKRDLLIKMFKEDEKI